ncbi:BTB/POZ domain-containing protein 6 [Araneus ventricosus]|uniref:BTB/POZ domain-containing protein 6 n=1 Tax=Araneus ventricosus TaxID=182803 RepID=A0A4Y2HJ09_ARAVE|nr:BTB/POZ domain-containing protein 6 [Araneus ventricosus]
MSQQLRPPSFSSVGKVLYLNEELRDLAVIVQTEVSQWKFPAHRLILAAESPVLRSKLEDETVNEIILDGLTPSTAELLLSYMYCGEFEVESWNEGTDLLEAAFKYEVEGLVQKCGRFLEDVISLSNVCYIYDKASMCSLQVLQHKCLKLILDAGFVVLRSEAFELLNKDCVMDIIASSDLNIDSELIVFETLFRWARIECCRTGLPITEANILIQIKPFLQHVCIDDMSDADKSALPPAILSCVKPNNRNRIGFSVPESLVIHSKCLELDINQNCLDYIGEHLSCLRFSIDSPIYLIGLRFTLVCNAVPLTLPLSLVKENTPKVTMFTHNLCTASSIQRTQVNQRVWHEIDILLRAPAFLKAGDIYNVYVMLDVGTDAQCPQTILFNNVLHTASGPVNFTVHGDDTWGIRHLIVI